MRLRMYRMVPLDDRAHQQFTSPITGFVRRMPDEARDGRNVALNYQVNCWCARLSKETIL